MRYLIFVKGDGRGHLTQTLSLCQLLQERGHQVAAVAVGCPKDALVPAFFFDRSPAPITRMDSPNLMLNSKGDHIDLFKTAWVGLRDLPLYRKTHKAIGQLIREHKPDVLINLFEPSLSLYELFAGHDIPKINISHQQLMLHSRFQFPKGRSAERIMVREYVRLVTGKATKNLGLSFYDFPDEASSKIVPVAPLLRNEVFTRTPTQGNHFVMYMVYHGIAEQIKAFNKQFPQREIHAFWNNKNAPQTQRVSDTLTFHQVNDTLFLDKLASAAGVATTAGFETVCEAMYYGKPAILLPMPGQYEQFINAFDAEKVGAGKTVSALNPQTLEEFIPTYNPQRPAFLQWLQVGKRKLVYHLENPTVVSASTEQMDAYFATAPLRDVIMEGAPA
jgi:uncharacterized protein (TIGR00661 family)